MSKDELLQPDMPPRADADLSALAELAHAINVSMSPTNIFESALNYCIRRLATEQGGVFLAEGNGRKGTNTIYRTNTGVRSAMQTAFRVVNESDSDPVETIHLQSYLSGWVEHHKTTLLYNSPSEDEQLRDSLIRSGINNVLASPMMAHDKLIGVIALFNKKSPGFSSADKRLIEIIAALTGIVVENSRLFEEGLRLEVLKDQMIRAREIQRRILPREELTTEHFTIYGYNEAAMSVGGDFYDMQKLPDGKVLVSVGDVSGKGLPAALLMANAQAIIRSQVIRAEATDLAKMATILNEVIYGVTADSEYLTCIFGILDPASRTFRSINCGHPRLIVVGRDGSVSSPDFGNPVIGAFPGLPFTEQSIDIKSGDTLCIFSDGIPDCENQKAEPFGLEQLEDILMVNSDQELSRVRGQVKDALKAHQGKAEQFDDITLLLARATF